MTDPQTLEALAVLIKALKGGDPKLLAQAFAMQGICLKCKGKFPWGKGVDVAARTIHCPHCGVEIVSF